MPRRKVKSKIVSWVGKEIINKQNVSATFQYYEKFQFMEIEAGLGDYVLISNADAAEPDTEEGCDAARIISLYEDSSNTTDPFRARVQWYSKPEDLPKGALSNFDMEPINFYKNEVIEDHRPFDVDVSIETFFKKCLITLMFSKDVINNVNRLPYQYICRYRLIAPSKRRFLIEPVLEEERRALQLLITPNKLVTIPKQASKTPSSLIKKMGRVSISEKNWSVSKNDGTKMLLKRAILADKNERESPKKMIEINTEHTTLLDTPKRVKNLTKGHIEEALSMELKENSEDELPILIIRNHTPSTPKRKTSLVRTEETPKKVLVFEDETVTYSTRSNRIAKKPVSYLEPDLSPIKSTPKRSIRKISHNEDSDEYKKQTPSSSIKLKVFHNEPCDGKFKQRTPRRVTRRVSHNEESDNQYVIHKTPKTPKTMKTTKTPKTPKTPRTPFAKTPSSVSKRIFMNQLTPTLHTRTHSIDNIEEFLTDNKSLPGRESQMDEILSFVRTKLLDGMSGCMYISGVPGTGKTATVNSALKVLKEEVDLPDFHLVEVNGMRIAEPRQAYVQIYKQLTGKSVVWEQACSLLEKRFTNPGPRRTPTVLVVDELDALCNRRQDVLYSIMEWAAHRTALLTVLAVANTMDLPERALAARVASRLGLTRLTFPPYTHTQLQCIVATRLAGKNVTPDAVQLIARKVAAVSGDARRALALCSRALELAGPTGAGLNEVQQALGEAASSAAVRAIRNCSSAERLMLRAVAAEVERTGSDETTLSRALSTAAAIVSLDGRPYRSATSVRAPTPSQALSACARLAAIKLLLLEPKPSEPRLLLNVSVDDVHYATKQITV